MSEILELSENIGQSAAVNSHYGLIVDAAIGLIFLIFALVSARRGLYKSVVWLVVLVLAICAGVFGANLLTQPAMDRAWPKVEETVSENFDSSVGKTVTELHDLVGERAEQLLSFTHLDDDAKQVLEEHISVSWTEAPKARLLELVNTALQEVIHGALFLIIFILGLILFKPLSKLVGKVTEAPILSQLDWLGGFLIGALECLAIFFIVIKICELRDISFFRDIQGSWFVSKMMGL